VVQPYAADSTVRARPVSGETWASASSTSATYHISVRKGSDQGSVQGSATSGFTTWRSRAFSGEPIALDARREPLEACFLAVMNRAAENDGYNALVLTAGLPWRDVAAIRTISRFLRQIRVPYSQDYMWATLRKHPASQPTSSRCSICGSTRGWS